MNALLLVLCLQAADDPRKMLYTHLQGECAKQFDARRKAIAEIKTPDDLRRRQEELRKRFIDALGGFPERTPLNPVVAGKADRDGYRIEKVIYESRPRHPVTAILYLPEGKGPFPGVLFPCGHYDNAKAAETYQRACILLAKHGIAALAFDPVSQGERVQLLAADGKPLVGRGTSEHTHLGAAALLVGECAASYMVWDGIRSLDYLASRPEIDPKRLGCLGNSGGGTQTAYLMALDERIAAAVPNCYITSLERLFATIGPQDAEQNIPGQVAFGMEHADYVTMRAPRPTLISATTRDFFDIQGAWTTYREAKRIYGMIGHGERVDLFEFNDPHAISKPIRESALRWFRRWLLEIDDAPVEPDFAVAKEDDLRCTEAGQVKGATAFDFVREKERSFRRGAPDRNAIRKLVALEDPSDAELRKREALPREGWSLEKGSFETEPGVRVPALLAKPEGGASRNPLVVIVHGEGKDAALPELEKLAKAGTIAMALDLRGMGETSPSAKKGRWETAFGAEWKETFLSMHLNRPLLGQRVRDLLSTIVHAEHVSLVGIGQGGPIVLHAAALSDKTFHEVRIEKSLVSWSDVIRNPQGTGHLPNVVPGALKVYDLPDLASLARTRKLILRAPVDALGQPVPAAALEEAHAAARKALGDALVLEP